MNRVVVPVVLTDAQALDRIMEHARDRALGRPTLEAITQQAERELARLLDADFRLKGLEK